MISSQVEVGVVTAREHEAGRLVISVVCLDGREAGYPVLVVETIGNWISMLPAPWQGRWCVKLRALLATYQVLRTAMTRRTRTPARPGPARASFTVALRAARDPVIPAA